MKVPVYGTGLNIRDWIYVIDHCRAIDFVITNGKPGEIYNIGSGNERTNLQITERLLELTGKNSGDIEFVQDRPGHDLRYSLDCSKLRAMGWQAEYGFEKALDETVRWYRENRWWWSRLKHQTTAR
jgi:dTDP-glucose 4,6-dehydratase